MRCALVISSLALVPMLAAAQFAQQTPPPAQPPRESAPFDMTGYWVSIVNEEWRWRMMTPPKGDTASITMLNARGHEVAEAWDPAEDGSCQAYGAAGLMRMPTRLHISWDSDTGLKIETDAGRQTRLLRFTMPPASGATGGTSAMPAAGAPSRQGYSVAQWNRTMRSTARRAGPPPPGGSLEVRTTNLLPGWLRRNGVPYSEQTTLTEYFDQFEAPNGDEWLVVTTIVEDPVYLNDEFITSSHFRREPNDNRWEPKPCRGE